MKSRKEAIAWTKRFPNPAVDGKEGEFEVRQLIDLKTSVPVRRSSGFATSGLGRKSSSSTLRRLQNNFRDVDFDRSRTTNSCRSQ